MTRPIPAFETIGPAKAKLIFANHEASGFGQRTLRPRKILMFSKAISDGRVESYNGETIKIGTGGELLDGQHRLAGVIDSGKSVTFLVVRGVDPATFTTIDTGDTRTISDILTIDEVDYAAPVGSAATALVSYLNRSNDHIPTILRAGVVGKDQARERALADTSLREVVALVYKHFKFSMFPVPSTLAFCWRVCRNFNKEAADAFFLSVASGEYLTATSPAMLLRNRLIETKAAVKTRVRYKRPEIAYFCFRAFKAQLNGERLRKLSLPKGELNMPKLRRSA